MTNSSPDAYDLTGRCAFVMGGGGGLGSAIAHQLGSLGARVVVADIDETAARAAVQRLTESGHEGMALPFDVSALDTFASTLERVQAQYGTVDILVNMTGGPPPSTAAGVSPEQWSEYFQSMVLGVIHFTDLVLDGMRASGWGRVITSTSSGVVSPIPNLGISNTLRASLVAWSKTLANEVGRDGVTANVVLPGRIATQRIRQLDEARATRENKSVDQVSKESTMTIPVGRYGDPAEYAAAVAFLASPAASYITGSVLRVDGGMIGSI